MARTAEEETLKGMDRVKKAQAAYDLAGAKLEQAWKTAWPELSGPERVGRWQAEYSRVLEQGRPVFWRSRSCHRTVMPSDYDGSALV